MYTTDGLKTLSVAQMQKAIATAIGDLLGREVTCLIGKIEFSLSGMTIGDTHVLVSSSRTNTGEEIPPGDDDIPY